LHIELFLGLVDAAERGGEGRMVVVPTDDDSDSFVSFSSSSKDDMMKVKEGKDKPPRS
jgi:hypothetical protein